MKSGMKLIYGVAINDYKGKVSIDGKFIKPYKVWYSMLNRCYSEKYQNRYPTYKYCTVCKEWLSFSNFKKWYDENYPQHLEDNSIKLDLDKDLLVAGNKTYSPATCIFIPHEVNNFLTNARAKNTSGYTGVSWNKQRNNWRVYVSEAFSKNKRIYIGSYKDINKASDAYIKAKKEQFECIIGFIIVLGYSSDIIEKIKSNMNCI